MKRDTPDHRTARSAIPVAVAASIAAIATALLVPGGSSARPQVAPKNVGQPRAVGTPVQGETLSTTNGTWTGTAPLTFRYRWLRCDTTGGGVNGVNCTTIPGETRKTYILTRADVGHRIRSRVIGSNAEGTDSANSNATPVVKASATAGRPVNGKPPTIAGTSQQGQTLTANAGSWTGGQPMTFTYQWRRCDQSGGSCSDISGATGKTYVVTSADVGNTLRVRVTAKNTLGSRAATSIPTGVIAKAEAPSGSTVSINDVSLPNRLLIDAVSFRPQPLRSRRTITARFHVSDSRNHSVQGAAVQVVAIPFGTTTTPPETATGATGWATFKMQPTSRVRFGRGGGIVMFVRARKEGERLIGGVSTRRLVQLSIR
jgi:hypothetical protein